jgi:hypothetical protein
VGTFDISVFLDYAENVLNELLPGDPARVQEIMEAINLLRMLNPNPAGADLWVTQDGATWNSVTLNGFGDKYNYGVRTILATDDDLFVGMANPFYGAEVWKSAAPAGGGTGWIAGPIVGGSLALIGIGIWASRRRTIIETQG